MNKGNYEGREGKISSVCLLGPELVAIGLLRQGADIFCSSLDYCNDLSSGLKSHSVRQCRLTALISLINLKGETAANSDISET
jgi:hypothetical protein